VSSLDHTCPLTYAITDWHICISGFRQHEGELSGLHRVWLSLLDLSMPRCQVLLREWDSDWRGLAELIWLTRPELDGQPLVNIYAYSWGVGHGFVNLARELGRRGITVDNAVLCDPIYHSRLLSMRWLAYTGWPAITIPANVRTVWGTHQRVSSPCGHPLKVSSGASTDIRENLQLSCGHRWADESSFFRMQVRKVSGVKVWNPKREGA